MDGRQDAERATLAGKLLQDAERATLAGKLLHTLQPGEQCPMWCLLGLHSSRVTDHYLDRVSIRGT